MEELFIFMDISQHKINLIFNINKKKCNKTIEMNKQKNYIVISLNHYLSTFDKNQWVGYPRIAGYIFWRLFVFKQMINYYNI